MLLRLLPVVFAFALPAVAADPDAWATYRGNAARTGNTDNLPGPTNPAVLWVVKSQDNYLAAPVPVGTNIYTAGLGGFNRPVISMIPIASSGEPKLTWQHTAPYLQLPSVSSPAVAGNLIVFGDGMHQNDGGILHCLTADNGRPVWQLPVPGNLVHLEGAPVIANGKVYMGAGAGGVVCVELEKATLDGKDVTVAEIKGLQEARWKELLVKYEEAKKKDPELAMKPTDDQLLKPAPKLVWKKGETKWHVDAPLSVVGDKVIVCTSFLDKENVGERAIYCLNATTGETVWTQKLPLNPWGGASVVGDTVIVTGSSVGYYYTLLKGAKGSVAAFDLATGKPKWQKDVPGGIVACAALASDLIVCTATDGKVRAFAIADGDRKWIYDAKGALFAPPAIAGGTVYIGDLQGSVHAVNLTDGTAKWKLDIGADPLVKSPGMVYGGVTVHGGKLFVGSCNLEGPLAGKPTFMVCVGSK